MNTILIPGLGSWADDRGRGAWREPEINAVEHDLSRYWVHAEGLQAVGKAVRAAARHGDDIAQARVGQVYIAREHVGRSRQAADDVHAADLANPGVEDSHRAVRPRKQRPVQVVDAAVAHHPHLAPRHSYVEHTREIPP